MRWPDVAIVVLLVVNVLFCYFHFPRNKEAEVVPDIKTWLPLEPQQCRSALHKSERKESDVQEDLTSFMGPEPLKEEFVGTTQNTTIPPIIHQIHFQSRLVKDWSEELVRRFGSWDEINPGHLHIIWDEHQAQHFFQFYFTERVATAYMRLPRVIHKTDLLRYALLYYIGGYYVDSDTECYRPVGEWPMEYHSCNITFIVGIEWDSEIAGRKQRERMQICQWAMASVPQHPILRAIINHVVDATLTWPVEKLADVENVLVLAGPIAWTNTIARFLTMHGRDLNEMHIVGVKDAGLFPGGVLLLPLSAFNWPQEAFQHSARAMLQHYFAGFAPHGWRKCAVM